MWLLKSVIDTLAPFLTTLLTTSLQRGECAVVEMWHNSPAPQATRSRPAVCRQLPTGLQPRIPVQAPGEVGEQTACQNGLMPTHQSAYWDDHSTEIALLTIINYIVDAISYDLIIDLSAVFDAVDHCIFVCRLELSCGIKRRTMFWLSGYLEERSQVVS